mmetsp:Transcript_45845/g.128979  ORF Transcript_45845/g.128979 Transcript_45845/m.128979 type:complete len:315 (+) Transcript_45845:61-1005(+)
MHLHMLVSAYKAPSHSDGHRPPRMPSRREVEVRERGEDEEAAGADAVDEPLAQVAALQQVRHEGGARREHHEGRQGAEADGEHGQRRVQGDHRHLRPVPPLGDEDREADLRRGGDPRGALGRGAVGHDVLLCLLRPALQSVLVGVRREVLVGVERCEHGEGQGRREVQGPDLEELRDERAEPRGDDDVEREAHGGAQEGHPRPEAQGVDEGHEPSLVEELRHRDHREGTGADPREVPGRKERRERRGRRRRLRHSRGAQSTCAGNRRRRHRSVSRRHRCRRRNRRRSRRRRMQRLSVHGHRHARRRSVARGRHE